jgi:dienelactone hydrolase
MRQKHPFDAAIIGLIVAIAFCATSARGEQPQAATGKVEFKPVGDDSETPELFRLAAHSFDFSQSPIDASDPRLEVANVTFPSPVETPHAANNVVHCEYYRPKVVAAANHEKRPAVVVLHILGGDFALSRLFCCGLAQKNVHALFVYLPYYGPRRAPGVDRRMIDVDPRKTVEGMRQGVLDIRRAAAFLATRPDVDEKQIGVFGISLGGITASLAGAIEPRFAKTCTMLAGGGFAEIAWNSRETSRVKKYWESQGETYDSLAKLVGTIDPVTYGDRIRGRKVLMLNALHDEVVPRQCTDALWKSFGKPPIVWYNAGHYSALRYLFDGIDRTEKFFQPDEK